MNSLSATVGVLALFAGCSYAAPSSGPNGLPGSSSLGYCQACTNVDCVNIAAFPTDPVIVDGTPLVYGPISQPGEGMAVTFSYSTGYSWTVGGGLGIDFGSIGFTAAYTESVSSSISEGSDSKCPLGGNWQCMWLVTPQMWSSSGYLGYAVQGDPQNTLQCVDRSQPFTALVNVADEAGNSLQKTEVCLCPNADGSPLVGTPVNPDSGLEVDPPVCPQCLTSA